MELFVKTRQENTMSYSKSKVIWMAQTQKHHAGDREKPCGTRGTVGLTKANILYQGCPFTH